MIDLSDRYLLMIEPQKPETAPVIDELTALAIAVFDTARSDGTRYRGVHRCVCGATSDNTNWILPSGHITNSLMVHYVARHRDEVPESEIEKLHRCVLPQDPS